MPGDGDLRALLDRYQALVEYAPDAIVILDLTAGHFVTVNTAAEQLFGMSRAELLRVGPVEVSPPVQPDGRSSQSAAMAHIERALAGERPRFEWVHRRADGRDVPCEVNLLRLPSTDRLLVRGSVLDISERREAEAARAAALAEQAARRAAEASVTRLQATVAGLNAIVWERDPQTLQLTFVNERAEELLGYSAVQWLADDGLWLRILHPDDRDEALARVHAEVASGGVDFAMTYRVRAADGRWVWLRHLGHIARDESGAARTLHAVLIDVTEARRREQAAALLAAAGRALASPGPIERRLREVAELVAGELGDWAGVWLRGDDERYRPVAVAPTATAARARDVGPVRIPERFAAEVRAGRAFAVPEVTEEMRREAAGGDDQYAVLTALGSRAWLAAPLPAGGEVVGLLTVAADDRDYDDADVALAVDLGQRIATTVAAERLATRQRQLHEVTAALAAAGTVAEAAAELAAGLRQVLGASVVGICRLEVDGLLHLVHDVGYPPDRLAHFAAVRLNAPFPFAEAARTGRPVWLPDRRAWRERYPESEPFLLEETKAAVALPLKVGGRVLGTVAVSFPAPRLFDAAERAFLLSLTDQAAAAFERATLADARREMAETLQRSLLPGQLPALDRAAVVARYLPAVAGTSAGGDWYDVLALPNGRVAVAVGDVVGHGAAAAAVMGQLRSSLATLMLAGFSPGPALDLLDSFAGRIAGARVSTVACLELDPVSGRLAYSRAGHPPPLVVDRAGGTFLDQGHGPALGLPHGAARPEAVTTLPSGATLVVFTDGLIEEHGVDLDEGLRRLADVVAARRTAPLAPLVDGALAELVAPGGAADDIAVVAVRLLPAPLHLVLPADPAELARVRRTVARWAAEAPLGAEVLADLQLALGEAVANAVEHAHHDTDGPGRVTVDLEVEGAGGVAVTVRDSGIWRPVAVDPGFRGRGLQIVAALAGDVDLAHGPAGTVLRFRLPPAAASAPASAPARLPVVVPAHDRGPATLLVTEVGGRRCLELTGDLDLAGVEAVRDALLTELTGDLPVTLDLTRLGFVASVGVGLLLEAVQAAGDDLETVLPAGGPARRLLDLTGLIPALQGARAGLPR
jgi:anti-anti-sigma factor